MGQLDLALFVGEQKSFRPLQNAEAPALKTGGVFSAANAFATSFNSDHSNMSIVQKRMEQANGVAAAADTGDEQIRQTTFAFENLMARLNANDSLKIADHHGVRMGAENRAQYIMSGAHVRDPVAHRFVDRFLERGLPSCDRNNFRAEKFHARDVERLAFHIDPAHVNHALAPKRAATVAVATPCCPAPVSAMMRRLPIRCASKICPRALLILCAPVWSRSSRFK